MIRELLILAILILPVAAFDSPQIADPNVLKIVLLDYSGVMHTMMVWQDETGKWTIFYDNEVTHTVSRLYANETGFVKIA